MKASRLLHLVARRGNACEYPENMVSALRSAIALGARFIELDVELAPDGVPLVVNDGERAALSDALALLNGRPEATVFVSIGRASAAQFGHEQVASQVIRALRPFRFRCVLASADLPTIHSARSMAGYPIAWILPTYDDHTRLKFEALQPEYLFCDRAHLPPPYGALWRGPWKWVIYEVDDLRKALECARWGADFVVTRHVRELRDAMRMHALRKRRAQLNNQTLVSAALTSAAS